MSTDQDDDGVSDAPVVLPPVLVLEPCSGRLASPSLWALLPSDHLPSIPAEPRPQPLATGTLGYLAHGLILPRLSG